MTDDQISEFIRLSTLATVIAMVVCAVGYVLASYGALRLGRVVRSRTSMSLLAGTTVCLVLFAAYVAYALAFAALQAELEYRFTKLRSICHLPALIPLVLPLGVFLAVWLLSVRRRPSVAAV